jgi:hypothetical protein
MNAALDGDYAALCGSSNIIKCRQKNKTDRILLRNAERYGGDIRQCYQHVMKMKGMHARVYQAVLCSNDQ